MTLCFWNWQLRRRVSLSVRNILTGNCIHSRLLSLHNLDKEGKIKDKASHCHWGTLNVNLNICPKFRVKQHQVLGVLKEFTCYSLSSYLMISGIDCNQPLTLVLLTLRWLQVLSFLQTTYCSLYVQLSPPPVFKIIFLEFMIAIDYEKNCALINIRPHIPLTW